MRRNERGVSLIILVIAIVLMAVLVAVGVVLVINNDNTKEIINKRNKVELTERQIEILEKEGLPTEYEELDSKYKKGIVNIENSLTYLEDKYPSRTFEYIGYFLNDEYNYLTARTKSDEGYEVGVTVRSYEDGTFIDNCEFVFSRDKHIDIVLDEAEQLLNNKKEECVRAYVDLYPDWDELNFYIFVNSDVVNEENYSKFVDDIEIFLNEKNYKGVHRVLLVDKDNFEYMTRYNYENSFTDCIQNQQIIIKESNNETTVTDETTSDNLNETPNLVLEISEFTKSYLDVKDLSANTIVSDVSRLTTDNEIVIVRTGYEYDEATEYANSLGDYLTEEDIQNAKIAIVRYKRDENGAASHEYAIYITIEEGIMSIE